MPGKLFVANLPYDLDAEGLRISIIGSLMLIAWPTITAVVLHFLGSSP